MKGRTSVAFSALLGTCLLLYQQVGVAEIFECKDPATGKKTYSDRACPDHSKGQEVEIDVPVPSGSSRSRAAPASGGTQSRESGGESRYTHQARASEKQRADSAAAGIERKVD